MTSEAPRKVHRFDVIVKGYYRTRLCKGGMWVPVLFRFGPPMDPETGEDMDRSHRWMCFVDGELHDDPWGMWPWCCGNPIDEETYRLMIAEGYHARTWQPDSPRANPRQPVDRLTARPPKYRKATA